MSLILILSLLSADARGERIARLSASAHDQLGWGSSPGVALTSFPHVQRISETRLCQLTVPPSICLIYTTKGLEAVEAEVDQLQVDERGIDFLDSFRRQWGEPKVAQRSGTETRYCWPFENFDLALVFASTDAGTRPVRIERSRPRKCSP